MGALPSAPRKPVFITNNRLAVDQAGPHRELGHRHCDEGNRLEKSFPARVISRTPAASRRAKIQSVSKFFKVSRRDPYQKFLCANFSRTIRLVRQRSRLSTLWHAAGVALPRAALAWFWIVNVWKVSLCVSVRPPIAIPPHARGQAIADPALLLRSVHLAPYLLGEKAGFKRKIDGTIAER